MVFKLSIFILALIAFQGIQATELSNSELETTKQGGFVQVLDEGDESYQVVTAEGQTVQEEEECDCIDGENCLEEVEVAIQCIDGDCTVKLLTDTDIDFNADLKLVAVPVEDNGHCCE
jgi:hypothetical protein